MNSRILWPGTDHHSGPLPHFMSSVALGHAGGAEDQQPGHPWLQISGSEVTGPHGVVSLGDDELRLLRLLAEQPESVFTPETILSFVWGPYYIRDRKKLQDSLVALRRLLSIAGLPATAIEELRGIGYRLQPSIEVRQEPVALSA